MTRYDSFRWCFGKGCNNNMKLLTTIRNVYTHFVCNLVYCAQRTEWRFCLHPLAGRVITQTSVKHLAPLSEKYCVFLQLRVLFESALQITLLPVIAKLILISSQSLIKGLHSRSKLERWQMKVATLPKTGCFTVPKSSEDLVFMFYLQNNTAESAHSYKSLTDFAIKCCEFLD